MFSRNGFRGRTPKGIELLLLEDPLALVTFFSQASAEEQETVGEAIGHIFMHHQRSADLLTLCATEEIYSSVRPEQLLRQDSVFITIMQQFIKRWGRSWLFSTLRKPLRKIIQSESYSLEIDKMRLSANEDLATNRNNLEDAIRSLLDPIFDNPDNLPPEIRAFCRLLFRLTNEKFPGKGYKVLSGSLFLRFICPFMGSPNSWRLLTSQEILPETRRKLILVTKVVQGIANENIEFNESYMNQINDLLQEYTIKLHKFYDRLNRISNNIYDINWPSSKEKKSLIMSAVQALTDFFVTKYDSIVHEVIVPLAKIYPRSEVFGRRLELLLWDKLSSDQRYFINHGDMESIKKDVSFEMKDLRKIMGKNLWSIHFEELRESVEQAKMNDGILGCLSIFHLHSLVLPRKVYNIDNDSNSSLGMEWRLGVTSDPWTGVQLPKRYHRNSSFIPPTKMFRIDVPPRKSDSFSSARDIRDGNSSMTDLSDVFTEEEDPVEDPALHQWLMQLGFEEYYHTFLENSLTPYNNPNLSVDSLVEIGIKEPVAQEIAMRLHALTRQNSKQEIKLASTGDACHMRKKKARKKESTKRKQKSKTSSKDGINLSLSAL